MRKNIPLAGLLMCLVICTAGCATVALDTITQLSTIDAVLAGHYDGEMTIGDLLQHGDHGIGTFHALDGEMVLLNGEIYQVKADGKVYLPPKSATTPFAAAVHFRNDASIEVKKSTGLAEFVEIINRAAPNLNQFLAVKARGHFSRMKTRSVPAQTKPYPPLVEVTRHQPEFNLVNVSGTIVGFRTPDFTKGIAVPGYHVHFISDDRAAGGHILDFSMESGVIELDECNRMLLILPSGESAFANLDLGVDRSDELEEAEK